MSQRTPEELPREWLPYPVSEDDGQDATVWDERVRRLNGRRCPSSG